MWWEVWPFSLLWPPCVIGQTITFLPCGFFFFFFFLLSSFFFPRLISGYIFATKAHIDNRKNLLSSNTSSACPHNMANFGPLTAEIGWPVWGTPANFNGFRVLTALPHGTPVVGVSQTLRRWTKGATYIRQGDHHVGHWPTFLVTNSVLILFWKNF